MISRVVIDTNAYSALFADKREMKQGLYFQGQKAS